MVPAACDPTELTVVVVPLTSLRQDLHRRCVEVGLECAAWDWHEPPDAASVVLVTPESAMSDGFATFLNRAQATRRLARLVVDECHLVFDDFRPAIRQLARLTRLRTQLVLLTATLPVRREDELWDHFGYRRAEVSLFRAPTTRPNIRYEVVRHSSRTNAVAALVTSAKGKAIVYCRTVDDVKAVAARLECAAYYADAPNKQQLLADFVAADEAVIAATNALGLGVDIPDIRLVVHMGEPATLLDFAQESGRAGRDGRRSRAVVVAGGRLAQDMLIKRFVDRNECRRIVLDEYLDGRTNRRACEAEEEPCDVCFTGVEASVESAGASVEALQRETAYMRVIQRGKQEALDLDELKEELYAWANRCVVCCVRGRADDHELYYCSEGSAFKDWVRATRSAIRFPQYAACFGCGLPPALCGAWDEHSETKQLNRAPGKRCPHQSTMYDLLAGFACPGLDDLQARWTARLASKQVPTANIELVREYLATKTGEHREETTNLVREFCWASRLLKGRPQAWACGQA
jgi:hypothetical protein